MFVSIKVLDDVAEGAGGAAAKFATAAKVGTALKIAGISLAVIGVVLDVVTIGITAKDVHEGSKSKLADKLRDIADNMENKMIKLRKDSQNAKSEKDDKGDNNEVDEKDLDRNRGLGLL